MAAHFAFEAWVPVLTSIVVISDGLSETLNPSAGRNWSVSPVADSIVPTRLSPAKTGESIRALVPAIGGHFPLAAVCAKPVAVLATIPTRIKVRNFISVPSVMSDAGVIASTAAGFS
jgi:hypothetical protein